MGFATSVIFLLHFNAPVNALRLGPGWTREEKREDQKGQVLAMGCHHKTGTMLLQEIESTWEEVLGQVESVTSRTRHDFLYSNARRYQCLDVTAFNLLKKSDYRLVHVIRDPLETVISGYWYHSESYDTQLVPNTGPQVLKHLSLADGLSHEARSEIQSTLSEMSSVVKATQNNENVLTISLEDFVDDFNGTTALMFDFLFGKDHIARQDMIQKASACDEVGNHIQSNHINSKENYFKAVQHINQSKDPIWSEVRAFRQELGFFEVAPGHFRLRRDRKINFARNGDRKSVVTKMSPEDVFAAAEMYVR